MPPWMPRSSFSSPNRSACISARASSSETSVKTAIVLETQYVPDALAVLRADLVGRQPGLRRHRDLLGLSADPQFVDLGAAVFDVDAFDLLVLARVGLVAAGGDVLLRVGGACQE